MKITELLLKVLDESLTEEVERKVLQEFSAFITSVNIDNLDDRVLTDMARFALEDEIADFLEVDHGISWFKKSS